MVFGANSRIGLVAADLTSMTFQHQADAVLSQANPVSATLYTVLGTTANVRILTIDTNVTWAVTQPTPLVCRVKYAKR